MIKPLGFFPELAPGWNLPPAGPIREAVRQEGEPDEDGILAYLRSGLEIYSEMGGGPDVLGGDDSAVRLGTGSLHTDGEWLWRADLPYYVATHHVALPEQFLSRVRKFGHRAPGVTEARALSILAELGIDVG